jgi:hypothetical protein
MLFHVKIYTYLRRWGNVRWLIKNLWIVYTLVKYLGKLSFSTISNIKLPFYCHSVQTDGLKIFYAVCATNLLWRISKQLFTKLLPSIKRLNDLTINGIAQNSLQSLVRRIKTFLKKKKSPIGFSVSELEKLLLVSWIFQNDFGWNLNAMFQNVISCCILSERLHFVFKSCTWCTVLNKTHLCPLLFKYSLVSYGCYLGNEQFQTQHRVLIISRVQLSTRVC